MRTAAPATAAFEPVQVIGLHQVQGGLVTGRKERRLTETMSEASEATSTTTNATSVSGRLSFDNAEELRELAAMLHVEEPELLQQERIRVDRRKLEQMLMGMFIISFFYFVFFFK